MTRASYWIEGWGTWDTVGEAFSTRKAWPLKVDGITPCHEVGDRLEQEVVEEVRDLAGFWQEYEVGA